MAEIHPFRGVRYNRSRVTDLAGVICPPYDIITPPMAEELYRRSEHNFVRLEFNRELPQDTATDNRYTRAAAILNRWLAEGVLEADGVPALYLHDHYFTHEGREFKRRGMIVRVRLETWDKMVIRPHEGTQALPKHDRLRLLWALQADISPIFAMFEDQKPSVMSLLAESAGGEPIIDLSTATGERHHVWAITAPEVVNQVCRSLAHEPLYIADGHHRYESALAYQRQRRDRSPSASGDEAFNFVMMTLVPLADPGLIILPPHRLVRGISRATLAELTTKLPEFFEMEELPLNMPDAWQQVDSWLSSEESQVSLLLCGLIPGSLLWLRLRDQAKASQMMPYFHTELYKRLEVSIVDHIILDKLLGLGGSEAGTVAYNYDQREVVAKVQAEEYQLALLLRPIKPGVIKAIADAGDRMPHKSTYFYTKLPAGLVFYRLV